MRFKFVLLICMIAVLGFAVSAAIAQEYQPAGDAWITKWWALDGIITNTGGHVASAAIDWLSEGTGGKMNQESVSTLAGVGKTLTAKVSLPDNGGDFAWTVITLDPEDSHNGPNAYGLGAEVDNFEIYAIIIIDSPTARTTTIYPAHDDYGHIWINGKKVYDNPEWTTGATLVTTPTDVDLAKGENVLLFRFGESGGDDYMNLHFEASDADLKIIPTMDGKFWEFTTAVDPGGKAQGTWGGVKKD
jgi:hypothetical protein